MTQCKILPKADSSFFLKREAQCGFTLVELMVAVLLGLLIMLALTTLFVNISRNNTEMAKTNAQIENGRFAIQILENDLVHAGFWGGQIPAAPTAIPDPCLPVATPWDAAYKNNMLSIPVLGYGSASVPGSCTTVSGMQANSDVLVVRHANTCLNGVTNCDGGADTGPHIQVSECTSTPPEADYVIDSTTFPLKVKGCATVAARRKVVSNIYYISNNTLMRVALVNGTYQAAQPLIDGIETLRFEYGIDSVGNDGVPDSYVSCAPCTLSQLTNIVSVKIHILARNLRATPGYTDTKSYQLGATTAISAANDGFKRHVFSTTVRLVNPSGRREAP